MSTDKMALSHALLIVERDAGRTIEKCQQQLTEKPLRGWSQEKHETYLLKEIAEARATQHYCFIRQMQINPD
jgi:hypothetical protein